MPPDGPVVREAPLSLFRGEGSIASPTAGGLYWQLHQSFILIQIRGGLVIIDQHAAHERVLFDRARSSLSGSRAVGQSLLFPATITLSPDEFERYESLGATLESEMRAALDGEGLALVLGLALALVATGSGSPEHPARRRPAVRTPTRARLGEWIMVGSSCCRFRGSSAEKDTSR